MSIPKEQSEPTVGIITALEEEYVAMKTLLKSVKRYVAETSNIPQECVLGNVISNRRGKHRVVLIMVGKGTNAAALGAERMVQNFPSVRHIIMTGIAGGCPNPKKADEHVRLGDIVVSGEFGVIQYDFKVETSAGWEPRHPPRPPSPALLEAVNLLDAEALEKKKYPWINSIRQGLTKRNWKRPSARTDNDMEHPKDEKRRPGIPRVFIATIACANTLVKSPELRDKLRDVYKVKAVEMETSGIADATLKNGIGYFAVRGICDYCDPNKNDVWHQYASMAAAGYTVTLLASIPSDAIDGFSDSIGDRADAFSSDKVFKKIPEIRNRAYEIKTMTERHGPKDRQLNNAVIELIHNISAFLTHVKCLDHSTSSFIKESVIKIESHMIELRDFMLKSHRSAAFNTSLGSYLSALVVALTELRVRVAKKEPNGF